MLKHLTMLLLSFVADLAGNLVAGWIQRNMRPNFFTPRRLIGIGVVVPLPLLALLETK